jgi:hypothetical protein
LWKLKLQELADETGITIDVCHLPPGTSKWNKIEHRLFCHITQNWRGRPLTSRQVVVNLIAHTTTTEGLRVNAMLDENSYPTYTFAVFALALRVKILKNLGKGEWFAEFPNALMIE